MGSWLVIAVSERRGSVVIVVFVHGWVRICLGGGGKPPDCGGRGCPVLGLEVGCKR